jgi:hypothetical protein
LAGLLSPGAAQILVTLAIRDSGSSRVSMILGTAPLVSVTLALLFLDEPASAPLIAGAVLIVAGGVLLAREPERPAHLNRLGLVFAFAGATLLAIRDNLVRHLEVGTTAVPPAVAGAAALLGGTVPDRLLGAAVDRSPLAPVRAGRGSVRSFLGLALRGLRPRPRHRRSAARRGRVARRRRPLGATPPRLRARRKATARLRRLHRRR